MVSVGQVALMLHRGLPLNRMQIVAVGLPVLVAVALVAHQMAQPDSLTGVNGYDDGVYMAGSLLMWRGVMPFADFTFLHPPGILFLLGPAALSSHLFGEANAFVLARVATAGVAVANVGLVALVVRRHGPLAMFAAGIMLATFPAAVAATQTVSLEPWMVLFSLSAAVILFDRSGRVASRRRQLVAGALLGAGMLVKLWVAAVAVAAVATVFFAGGRQQAQRVAGVAAAVFAVPMVLIAVISRGGAITQAVLAQAGRERTGPWAVPIDQRLAAISGHAYPINPAPWWVLPAALAVVIVVLLSWALRWGRLRPVDNFVLAAGTLMVASVLVAPQFYPYYPYFAFVGLALVAGTVIGLVTSRPASAASASAASASASASAVASAAGTGFPAGAKSPMGRSRVGLTAGVVGAALVVVAVVNAQTALTTNRTYLAQVEPPSAILGWAVPAGACVASDSYAPLILADRFIEGVGDCRIEVDPFGLALLKVGVAPSSNTVVFDDDLTTDWRTRLLTVDAVVLVAPYSNFLPWPPGQREWFDQQFYLFASDDGAAVYLRR